MWRSTCTSYRHKAQDRFDLPQGARHFNIHAKLVEPGYAPTTRFTQNTEVRVEDLIPKAYADFAAPIFEAFARPALTTKEADVAAAVWAAVNDAAGKLRFPAAPDALELSRATQ
jgi:hypothetical protein